MQIKAAFICYKYKNSVSNPQSTWSEVLDYLLLLSLHNEIE